MVFDIPAEAMAAIATVQQFTSKAARANYPLHLLLL
jgi:hypothetical protein